VLGFTTAPARCHLALAVIVGVAFGPGNGLGGWMDVDFAAQ
jgi:hypothetical protein